MPRDGNIQLACHFTSRLCAGNRRQARGSGGARGYLAVSGGLDMPVYLGSRATFPGGKLGGVQVQSPSRSVAYLLLQVACKSSCVLHRFRSYALSASTGGIEAAPVSLYWETACRNSNFDFGAGPAAESGGPAAAWRAGSGPEAWRCGPRRLAPCLPRCQGAKPCTRDIHELTRQL